MADKKVYLVNNGDFRDSACVGTWPKQEETLKAVRTVFDKLGYESVVLPDYDPARKHGFITTQAEAARVLSHIPKDAPVVIVLSMWCYAHHMAGPLGSHEGPILLLANFDGTYPGLVAMLNHTGTLDRCRIKHSRLWTEGFLEDENFMKQLGEWAKTGEIKHSQDHLADAAKLKFSDEAKRFGEELAADILKNKRIMGQLDPGCMGMLNAVIGPDQLGKIGMPIEFLNQSDLLAEMRLVPDEEAQGYLNWLVDKGTNFHWGHDMYTELTHEQVMSQMKMYSAAAQIYDRYGLSAIGIPYQYGLVRSVPSSDLVEGMLNNSDRPEVKSKASGLAVNPGTPIPHFNEGDMGAGIPQVLMNEIYQSKGMAPETTLHDVRWGREHNGEFIWVFLISGGAPPAHWNGWQNTHVYRQPPMYFPLGGGTCSGVSKPGTITWARFYESFGEIGMDCGVGEVRDLPEEEVEDRLQKTSPEWPIANTVIPGYGRDELMSTHMSNHIVIGYGDILQELAATCLNLGMKVRIGGDVKDTLK
jgi:L-fucose isomerase-like protein